MRLIKGRRSWWCLHESNIAELPGHAVRTDTPDLTPSLVTGALQALREAHFFTPDVHDTYSLTVLTSTACNLGCGYCFQNVHRFREGDHAPDRIPLRRLDEAGVDDILAFAGRMMREAGVSKLKLMLFGGEPLLNVVACRVLLRRAVDYGLTEAGLVTNGVLLTPQLAAELAAHKLRLIQVTFDGDRTTHDRIRTTRNGGGTFDQIVTNVAAAIPATPDALRWQLRINISHRNDNRVPHLLSELAERLEPHRCTINLALVDDVGIGYANQIRYSDAFADEYQRWLLQALDLGFAVRTPQAAFFCDVCSVEAGGRGAVVNADGVLYSCWETVGKPNLEVGDVHRGYLPAAQRVGRWRACADAAAPHGEAAHARQFHDRVDAALLDALSDRNLL